MESPPLIIFSDEEDVVVLKMNVDEPNVSEKNKTTQVNWSNWSPLGSPSEVASTSDSKATAPSTAKLDPVALVEINSDEESLASNFEANCSVAVSTTPAKKSTNPTAITPSPSNQLANLNGTTTPVANTAVSLTPLKGRANGKAIIKKPDGGLAPPKSEFAPPKMKKRFVKVRK